MKQLDKIFDNLIETSQPFRWLVAAVADLSDALGKIASNLAVVVHNQEVHHKMIEQIYINQSSLMKKLGSSSIDTSLPSIDQKVGKGSAN